MTNENYITLKIKSKTAEEFRKYSRSLGKQQTDSLQLMLDFFYINSLSPLDELGPNFTTLEKRIKMRINALVAIIRDIEKTQTKPTLAMLQLLFQHTPAKKDILVEKSRTSEAKNPIIHLELQKRNQLLQKKLNQSRDIFRIILKRVAISRSSFGKIQLRLLMTQSEYEEIKQKIENL